MHDNFSSKRPTPTLATLCRSISPVCFAKGHFEIGAPGGIAPVEAYMDGLRMHARSRMSCPLRMVEPDPLGSRGYTPTILLASGGTDLRKT